MPAEIVAFNATMHPILKDFVEIMVAINAWYCKSLLNRWKQHAVKIRCLLRILAMHEATFVNTQSIKNLRQTFFNNGP